MIEEVKNGILGALIVAISSIFYSIFMIERDNGMPDYVGLFFTSLFLAIGILIYTYNCLCLIFDEK